MKLMLPAIFMLSFELFAQSSSNGSGLQISYGNNGIQQLSYNGVLLENLAANGSDAFHIWHMRLTDLQGNVLPGSQYDWGEVNNGRSWSSSNKTWTYNYIWGQISLQFVQSGDTLNMNVTVVNFANSNAIFDGAVIYPFVLNFPSLPAGFTDPTYDQLAFNTTGPSVTVADYGQGKVVAVNPDATKPLYSGFQPANITNSYTPIISGTPLDGMPTFFPINNRPLPPGQTDAYTVSLRFAPSGTPDANIAADAYANWAQAWPPQLKWTDRRIIGTVYLASSPSGNPHDPGGYPNNPRRYFNDSNSSDFDIRTAAGLASFQSRILAQAVSNVQNLKQLHAQGAITWDIEGEQYPQDTSYVCEPDLIAQAAPEMESIVTDPASPYHGMKLDDAYFKTMTDAGFRVGVCIRPQQFTLNSDGTASQVTLPTAQVTAQLIRKTQYAHDRWGATLFYFDSTVDSTGAALSSDIFQQVAAAFPDSLLMPEETTPKHYAYTSPFLSFIFHTDLGTPADVYSYYPNAFSANLVNDVDSGKLAQYLPQLTASVERGDILMVHADYWQANNPTVVQIYQNAGGVTPPPPPVPTPVPPAPAPTPPAPQSSPVTITSPQNGQTLSGVISVAAQINVTLDAAGSYLLVDGSEVGTNRVTGAPFVYLLDTSTLSNGAHNLQIWAHDTNNDTLVSPPVAITTANSSSSPPAPTPPPPAPANSPAVLTYPVSGQTISGIVVVTGTITAALDSAGSYLMVDGRELGTRRVTSTPYSYVLDTSTLSSGTHQLQIWAHDIGNNTYLSNSVIVSVP